MADLKDKIKELPNRPGVYLMKDAQGVVIYVGKAKSLRNRVRSYFAGKPQDSRPSVPAMMRQVADIDVLETASEVEALLTESRLIKDISPKFNRRLKDGKIYPFLEISLGDDFPRVRVTREVTNRRSRYFGPFADVRGLRAAVQALQPVFRFCTCTMEIRAADDKRRYSRPCLLYYVKRCSGPCADCVSREDYRESIRLLVRFLEGKRSDVIKDLRARMQAAAEARGYERAAILRDEIQALQSLDKRMDNTAFFPEAAVAPVADLQQGLEELQNLLALPAMPRRVDGVDIANLGGAEAVGSLVSFVDAKPFKPGYRRFRIRGPNTRDDVAMIAEVVGRRFRGLVDEEEAFPDILLIDGGPQQLAAARRSICEQGIEPPTIISLAKREEEIYVDERRPPLRLKRRSPALRLLQYVRDEAHRFAQHYHHLLRRKTLKQQAE